MLCRQFNVCFWRNISQWRSLSESSHERSTSNDGTIKNMKAFISTYRDESCRREMGNPSGHQLGWKFDDTLCKAGSKRFSVKKRCCCAEVFTRFDQLSSAIFFVASAATRVSYIFHLHVNFSFLSETMNDWLYIKVSWGVHLHKKFSDCFNLDRAAVLLR